MTWTSGEWEWWFLASIRLPTVWPAQVITGFESLWFEIVEQ